VVSSFCKGLLFYRPSFYYNYDGFRSIVNQTNLFMTQTLKNNTDAYVLISDSSFTNLNAYTKVLSLANIGTSAPYELLTQGVDSFTVPMVVNKGIVMNLEDFGGIVEIVHSTFQ
jgi:hypothetical protein